MARGRALLRKVPDGWARRLLRSARRLLGMRTPTVRASGGIVTGPGGERVLLVHRPRYDDWSFPKGKREHGETDEQCAVREVEEETGLRCRLGRELLPTRYIDGKGRDKLVRYWQMAVVGETPWQPGHEVDELRWCRPDEAAALLSYERDVEVLHTWQAPGRR
ncbi:MAG: NUDIX hydrolase [Acidimicrobiia bacterium]